MAEAANTFLSTAGHLKSCGNLGRPLSKAKYSSATDSELVPRGKGEKHPVEGNETVSETVYLQSVGAPCHFGDGVTAYLLHHESATYFYAAFRLSREAYP